MEQVLAQTRQRAMAQGRAGGGREAMAASCYSITYLMALFLVMLLDHRLLPAAVIG